jgi:hypothetical protein
MTESVNIFVQSVNNTLNYNLFKNTNFYHSKIIHITIKDINNNVISKDKNKFQTVLKDIWSTMRKEFLLENTSYNMREIDENNIHDLNENYRIIINSNSNSWRLSTIGKDAKGAIKEIINMIKVNNYSIEMYLKLRNNNIFYYSNLQL